jgi:hypothetical protein
LTKPFVAKAIIGHFFLWTESLKGTITYQLPGNFRAEDMFKENLARLMDLGEAVRNPG